VSKTLRSLLEEAGYSLINTKKENITSTCLRNVLLRIFGENGAQTLLCNLCQLTKLTENELLGDYEVFEKVLKYHSARVVQIVARQLRSELWHYLQKHRMQHDRYQSYFEDQSDSGLFPEPEVDYSSIDGILNYILTTQTLEFVLRLPAGEHVVLLYDKYSSLGDVIAEFFDPEVTAGAPKGLFSADPAHFRDVENFLYSRLLGIDDKQTAMKKMSDWISQLYSREKKVDQSPPSNSQKIITTRIAGQDTWFFENGFEDEILSLEKAIGKKREHGSITFLCSYYVPKLKEQQIKDVVQSHSYVIAEDGMLMAYKATE
jgi:hypothetical protein